MTQKRGMRRLAPVAAVMLALAVAGCSDPRKPTRANFEKAITARMEAASGGRACLDVSDVLDPVNREAALQITLKQIDALVAAGLLAEAERKGRYVRYDFTPAGQKWVHKVPHTPTLRERVMTLGPLRYTRVYLCYARWGVDEVKKWYGPKASGEYQEATVFYTYKIWDVADWAKREDIRAAFPRISQAIEGAGSRVLNIKLVLSSEGWE